MNAATLGLVAVIGVVFAAMGLVAISRLPRVVKLLAIAALTLRVVGATIRYYVLVGYYDGVGDATRYYNVGLEYAEQFSRLDFTPLTNSQEWWTGVWWGTQFVFFPSGFVLSVIGPTMLGEFLVFAMLGFLGLVWFAVAFRRSYPRAALPGYLRWLWLFPSLWFWPSSVGKEAIVLLGVGLCVLGFVGRRERFTWPLLALGLFCIFAIRPQIAAVMLVSLVLAQWVGLQGQWTPARAAQGVLILIVGFLGITMSMQYLGIDQVDVEGVQTYMESAPARRVGGGSAIDPVQVGWQGIPLALINTLFRPFPWESRTVLMLASSLEMVIFWIALWIRRENVVMVLRHWRSDRMLRLAIPFIVLYAISLGLVHTNLGIIARQRVFLFPFFFLLLEARPVVHAVAAGASRSFARRGRGLPRARARAVGQ